MAWQKTRLDIFIPEDRRHALIKGETLPVRTWGAVLFVDISGFTKLTSFLSTELGPQRGAEELTRQLDPIYTELVDAVHTFRGSIIVISGDGITCWFDQDDGRRATTAAFRMQRSMARYETILLPTGQQISLGVKITLSVGPAQRFLVGDPKVQLIEALAGRELDEVGSAQHLLDKGEIAVSARLLKEIEAEVIVRSIRETMEGAPFAVIETKAELAKPDPWPEITQLDNEVARKWVFASIYHRIRDEEMEFLTELRQVVPMFIKFTGLDYDEDESAGEKLDRFVQQVQAVLLRYEGYLCQVTIGDKGSNIFIAFGAPIAHEDDVSRALAAALELRKKIAELGFIQPVQIGLTYGQLWAGAHGGQDARIYSVIGEEVNLAARLMSHAKPGQILVSPHILDTTSNYSFAPLSPIQLKGIPKPMTPFLLLGKARALSVPVQQNRLFGRASEQAILMQKLIDLTGGAPEPQGMILIEGEAGIGKSLLLTDFMEKADQLGVQNFTGYGDPVERSTPYFGIRPVFEALLGISDEEDVSTNQRKALSAIEGNPFLKDRVPLLSEVIPLRLPDNDLTGQMVGEARATSLREFLLEVLRFRLKEENGNWPAVIVLDDAQWLDPATWNLAGYISRELPGIQLAIGIRPLEAEEMGAQMEEEYRRLRMDSRTTFIQLHALHEEDITGLVARKLGVESLPDPVHEFIQARAQGNPFFSEEIAYALRDAGLIKLEHGRAILQPGAEQLDRVDFPQTIQGVITSRIDRLSPAHQLTLKVASVIGRVFLINMLSNVHPSRVNSSTLADYLTVLTQLGITELETPTPELTYLFKHVITQEVVYTLLTFAQRKQLHCAIAEWYELNYREDPSPYYPRLAHHWLKGEVVGKAIHYLDQAGEQALESYANEEMIRFISIAMGLADKGLDQTVEEKTGFAERLRRARWERMLGTARFRLGQLPEANAHLKRTLELLGKPMPDSPFWLSLNLLKELLQQISYRLFPKQLKRPLSNEQRAMQQELASVDLEGVFYYSQNNLLLAWGMLRRLNLAERLGDPALMAQGYSNMQLIVGLANLRGAYQTYRKLKEDSLEKADRTSVRIYALLRDAVVHFIRCDWQEATDDFNAGLQLAERLGDNRQWAELMAAFATSLHLQAEFEREHSLWKDQYQKFSRSESVQTLAWSLYGQGHSLLMLGQVDEAIRLIEASIAIPMKNADDKILDTSRYGALSLAYFRKGEYGKSLENILQHQRLSPSTPPLSSTVQEYGGMFEAVIGLLKKTETGGYSPSHTELARIQQTFRRIPHIARALRASPVNKASTYLYEGIYNEMSGNLRRARQSWRKCIELAEAFQQPYEQGRAHYEMGLNMKNPARAGHLEEAYRIFYKLHTPYEMELVENALEQATSASED